MSRSWDDLPTEWMLRDLAMLRTDELKAFIAQAVLWGFDEPKLTNNAGRIAFLRVCRDKAWSMLSTPGELEVPAPGRPFSGMPEKVGAERKSAPKPKPKPAPKPARALQPAPADHVFRPRVGSGRRPARMPVIADLCEVTAEECNAFLRSLPPMPLYGETHA